jgi:hypothetical protein
MAQTYSQEVIDLSKRLSCAHCGTTFHGSLSQARKVKYEGQVVYCSTLCRHAALRAKFSTPIPNRGPCPTCGKEFFSRTAKIFCSIGCYTSSAQFRERMLSENRKKALAAGRAVTNARRKEKSTKNCVQCGEVFYSQPRKKQKFCGQNCYRKYMADRFDRWVASPQGIALPQNFDEFLIQNELPCLVDGCGWSGHHLSIHMNLAHGVKADEFKRAAGFNLGTGVISGPHREALQAREPVGIATEPPLRERSTGVRGDYKSLEGKEHYKKARALISATQRECERCSTPFTPHTYNSRFCSNRCRLDTWYEARRIRKPPRERDAKGRFKPLPPQQNPAQPHRSIDKRGT